MRKLSITAAALLFVLSACMSGYTRLPWFQHEYPTPGEDGSIERYVPSINSDHYTFAVLGDSRGNRNALAAVMKDLKGKASFAFFLGDMVQEGTGPEFRHFLRHFHPLQEDFPVFPVIGNHELGPDDSDEQYSEHLGYLNYAKTLGKTLFVAVDDVERENMKPQLKWLDQVLADRAGKSDAVFLLMHMPPYVKRDDGWHKPMTRKASAALWEVLKKYRISAIFASHIHDKLSFDWNGIPVYVNGQAGAIQQVEPPEHGYMLVHVDGPSFRVEDVSLGTIGVGLYPLRYIGEVQMYAFWPWLGLACLIALVVMAMRRPGKAPAGETG